MLDKFRQRSYRLENIDIGSYTAEEYEGCIAELQLVNDWMGDARTLAHTLFKELSRNNADSFSILDVGAGSGHLLRATANWTHSAGKRLHAVGLELNERSAQAIIQESIGYDEIKAVRGDALHLPFADRSFDYVISSLFTHHFVDKQIIEIFREMRRVCARRIFVIDLNRHPIAYLLYTTVGKLMLHNRLLREDGALSILRSFKPEELFDLAQSAGLENISVTRHFPFRLVLRASGASAEPAKLGAAGIIRAA